MIDFIIYDLRFNIGFFHDNNGLGLVKLRFRLSELTTTNGNYVAQYTLAS